MFSKQDYFERPPSPYLVFDEEGENLPKYRIDSDKVHRIRSYAHYHAKILNVVSPSEIWLQHPNHITDKLIMPLTTQTKILPEANMVDFAYVMAPISEGTLARGRILRLFETVAYVQFIDHAFSEMVYHENLYEMPYTYRTHPWQAVPVILANIKPCNGTDWSEAEVNILDNILSQFSYVWVMPILTAENINDDSEYFRVLMNGLSDVDVTTIMDSGRSIFDSLGESIIELYYLSLPPSIPLPVDIVDALEQNSFPYYRNVDVKPSFDLLKREPVFDGSCAQEWLKDEDLFPQFSALTIDECIKERFLLRDDETLRITFVPESHLVDATPKRFYGMLMRFPENKELETDYANQLDQFIADCKKLSDTLDDFYMNADNKRELTYEEVVMGLTSGKRVFGVHERFNDDHIGNFYWQRVEVIKCKKEESEKARIFFKVRFLDTGGHDLIQSNSLYRIHPSHLTIPPLCLKLCMPKVCPVGEAVWSSQASIMFRKELHGDSPLVADIVRLSTVFDITDVVVIEQLSHASALGGGTVDEAMIRKEIAKVQVEANYRLTLEHIDSDDNSTVSDEEYGERLPVPSGSESEEVDLDF